MPSAKQLTSSQLRAAVEYDPATGLFRRTKKTRRGSLDWIAGTPNNWGHFRVSINGSLYLAHRLAWLYMTGEWPAKEIDHINCEKSDNRFVNLREADDAITTQNRRSVTRTKKSCGLLGAYKSKSRKPWMAIIGVKGRSIYLGLFDTAAEAHAAYIGAKRLHHKGCTL